MFNSQYMFPTLNRHLAVSTEYSIRKLIRRYHGRLKSAVNDGVIVEPELQVSLDRVLESLYLDADELVYQVKELELIVCYHRQLDKQLSYTSGQKQLNIGAQLQELEHQIFRVIGFIVEETAATTTVKLMPLQPQLPAAA
jgi:hypothetical protein